MALGPLFLGFMFFFDTQIALQANGAVHGVIDVFPDVVGWCALLYCAIRYSKVYPWLAELKKFIVLPLALSVPEFIIPWLFYGYAFDADGKYLLYFRILETVLLVSEAVFTFVLFGKMQIFSKGRHETPRLSASFCTGKYLAVAGAVLSLATTVASYLCDPGIQKYLNVGNNFFRVFFVWYGVIILFRAASKLSD